MLYVSIHIPKTAGTSFARSLTDIVDQNALRLDYQHERDHAAIAKRGIRAVETHKVWLEESFLRLAWRYRSDIKSLSRTTRFVHGHFPVLKYHPLLTWRKTYFITWVREPFARAISNYYYWQAFDAATMPDPLVKTVLDEQWSLETYLFHPALRNYQAMFLKGMPWKRINFFGVTERFSEDLQRLNIETGMNFDTYRENIGPNSDALYEHQHLKERFLQYHSLDAQLYDYARQLSLSP